MRIVVTGAAGFIGATVAARLLEEDHTVVGIDTLNDAYDPRIKEWRLARLQDRRGFTSHRIDLGDRDALSRAVDGADAVINLAARAGVRQSLGNPWIYYETNVVGTLNLLEICRQQGIRKLVLASTSSVYGDQKTQPFTEDLPTDRPASPYAASKKAAELLAFTYHDRYGIDTTVLRYFTVYGPAGRPDMSIFRFIKWVDEGSPLHVFGDGTQQRDFTFVDDIAKGTIAGLALPGYEVINLGSNRPISLLTVIGLIERELGKKADISFEPPNPLDVPATWANVAKARRLLGWMPTTSFEDGLSRTTAWYLENRELARSIEI